MSEALYQSIVLERARHPHFAGRPAVFNAEGQSENRMCGDKISVFLNGTHLRHEAQGCAILAASAELMCEAAISKSADEIAILSDKFERLVQTGEQNPELGDLNALAGIAQYPSRVRCATLPWSALRDAITRAGSTGGAVNG
ncbi:MAG: SUF system NifU family Fe-S cluster assembly protein [Rhodospirillales bacterium]|nr:SUF system NifU family Fe-S cluster assembly protein [Rhodospirillales bacterium]MDE2319145.1 SUF system NifU family Fe-S cluster assembly protein [Rhodospirillales bacterium]